MKVIQSVGGGANIEKLEALRREEEDLERLRWLLSPAHWPRVYAVLARVREEIRQVERQISNRKTA